jgi:hypothetical protein
MTPSTSAVINPIAQFLNGHRSEDQTPIPLKSTTFDILVEAGLAIVETTRLFENREASTIEATLTFPVPVHAVLFSLDVKIGDRTLSAAASAREEAREIYEEGLERGKSAILHEELLRGIHMLSVGHIPPSETIEVKTIWAMPVAIAGGQGHLRIPTTVGQIYGNSTLADGDDFTWNSAVTLAQVSVKSPDADVTIDGKSIRNATIQVPMNQPIDLVVAPWIPRVLCGRTAKGNCLNLLIRPAETSSSPLDIAILVDHSGSMGGLVNPLVPQNSLLQRMSGPTTHDRVVRALTALSSALKTQDRIDLWEFDTASKHIGSIGWTEQRRGFGLLRKSLASLATKLTKPRGGTEIGRALEDVIAKSSASSILLITDGKSHALDVHRLAGKGKRISVLLIGHDSLEANVGHLAALTGGDIFVASKETVDSVFAAAVDSLRDNPTPVAPSEDATLSQFTYRVSGASLLLCEVNNETKAYQNHVERSVAALATMLMMPRLTEEEARARAIAEGLVTHLTSLVLVDEAGATQEDLPTRRRVPLEDISCCLSASPQPDVPVFLRKSSSFARIETFSCELAKSIGSESSVGRVRSQVTELTLTAMDRIEELAVLINWDEFANDLSKGVLDRLDEATAARTIELAGLSRIQTFANEVGAQPTEIVIILLARSAARNNIRSAMRVAKAVGRLLDSDALQRLEDVLQAETVKMDAEDSVHVR